MNTGRSQSPPIPGSVAAARAHMGDYSVLFLRTYGILVTFVLLVVVVSLASPDFLTKTNLLNVASQWAPAGIMAVAMTLVILTGGFDLSVASAYALTAVTAAGVGLSYPPAVAFAAALAVGLVIGLVNGLLVTLANVNPFIATLGTSFMIAGITLVITGNAAYVVENPDFASLGTGSWFGVSYSALLLFLALVLGAIVLGRTVYGQSVYSVGGNSEASRLSGIRVKTIVASTYVLSGFSTAVAGIITASQLGSAQANIDPNIVFDVITIVVVGGTSLAGGFGSMWRTAVGLGIIATISNGFNLLDVSPYYQNIVKGAIIVGALALDSYTRRLASRHGQT